jgi:hypothetical protein
MPSKKPAPPPAKKVALYEKLIALFPDVELKGASMPYTSLHGNMFSFLNGEGSMGLRLPASEREAFMKKYKTALFEAHGATLKEYVTVPDALLGKTNELKKHFEESLAYARSLKPKAAKRLAKK